MDKNYLHKKDDASDNGLLLIVLSIGISVVGAVVYLLMELL